MQDFTGVSAKLYRAKENIFNLNSEIERFFNEGEYPAIPEHDRQVMLEAIEYHKNRPIPPRFAVLTGEIVHHLRSCFDHVVWLFSTGPQTSKMPVDFPVFREKPLKENELSRFDGKIHRITNPDVRAMIVRLQPYNAAKPLDDPLWIIHDLDIIDKHKELLLCFSAATRVVPIELLPIIEGYQRDHPEVHPFEVASQLKGYGPLQPCIAFRHLGQRETQPVVPSLMSLFNYTVNAVQGFADL